MSELIKGNFWKVCSKQKPILYYVLDYNTLNEDILCNIGQYLRSLLCCGIDIVQLRAKDKPEATVKTLVDQLLPICREEGVIFILNDFVDIAIQSGCDGVHVGQDDMSPREVRQLSCHLPDFIVGVTVGSINEALFAQVEGADYLGTVAIFPSITKSYEDAALSLSSLSGILDSLLIPLFCIGGLNEKQCDIIINNTPYVSGFCFVSRIQGAESPVLAVQQLRKHIDIYQVKQSEKSTFFVNFLSNPVKMLNQTVPLTPFILHYTNNVVTNFTANICLSLSATPLMSNDISEVEEIVSIADAVVINIGTLKKCDVPLFSLAIDSAINFDKLVLLDPVAYSVSELRRFAVKELIERYLKLRKDTSRFILKGNLGEIINIIDDFFSDASGICIQTKGTDSMTKDAKNYAAIASRLRKASSHWGIYIVATGCVDYISSPNGAVYYISNGSSKIQSITGSGCILSSIISIFSARFNVLPNSHPSSACLLGCILGTAFLSIAGEIAERNLNRTPNRGHGSYLYHFQDAISLLSMEEVLSKLRISLDPLNAHIFAD